MNNKGFTMIELLAVLLILGFVISIAAISVNDIIIDSEDKLNDEQKDKIVEIAKKWYLEEGYEREDDDEYNGTVCASMSDLSGYMDKEAKNIETTNELDGYVKIVNQKVNNEYTYDYTYTYVNNCKE